MKFHHLMQARQHNIIWFGLQTYICQIKVDATVLILHVYIVKVMSKLEFQIKFANC